MKRFVLLLFFLFELLYSQSQIQNIYEILRTENKYIYGDTLVRLFSGDNIKITGIQSETGIIKLKLKTIEKDSIDIITISLTKENFGSDKGMMLKITNPFDKKLTYKALIGPTKSGKFVETSLIPVKPNLMSIETWPYVFSSIILYDFKLE